MLGLSWAQNAYYFNNFRFFLDETEKKENEEMLFTHQKVKID